MLVRTQITLVCVTVTMFITVNPISALSIKDSADFTYQYNGDTTPGDPTVEGEFGNTGYAASTFNNLIMDSDGDILSMFPAASGPDTGLNMQSSVWDSEISDATGFTWEISIQLNHLPGPDFGGKASRNRHLFRVGDGSANSGYQIQLDWDAHVNGPSPAYFIGGSADPTGAAVSDRQHIFRMAQDANSNDTWLWVDGELVSDSLASNTDDNHWWGDFFGRPISSEIDYVRWEVGGFAPIPEPSSVSLLLIGVLALWSRRRH